jgi:hypothetical protein
MKKFLGTLVVELFVEDELDHELGKIEVRRQLGEIKKDIPNCCVSAKFPFMGCICRTCNNCFITFRGSYKQDNSVFWRRSNLFSYKTEVFS